MKIEKKKYEMEFHLIDEGECFIDCYKNICLKIVHIISAEDEHYNAVDVETGDLYHYQDDEMVKPAKATLVIE